MGSILNYPGYGPMATLRRALDEVRDLIDAEDVTLAEILEAEAALTKAFADLKAIF